MDSLTLPNSSQSSGNFWKTKEGNWAKWINVLLVGGGLLVLKALLPMLLAFAVDILHLIVLGAIIGAIVFVALDKEVRTLAWFTYKTVIKLIRRSIVRTNPIFILQTFIESLRKDFDNFEEKLGEIMGAKEKIDGEIDKAKDQLNEQMELASQGQKQHLSQPEIAVYTNQAGRLTERIKKFQGMSAQFANGIAYLTEMKKVCKVVIADKTNQMEDLKVQSEAMNMFFSAWKSLTSILKGNPDKNYFYEEAVEQIESDCAMKSGIIKQASIDAEEILKSVNLQNAVMEDKGAKLLAEWQKNGLPALLGDTTTVGPAKIPIQASYEVVDNDKKLTNSSNNKYLNLIK